VKIRTYLNSFRQETNLPVLPRNTRRRAIQLLQKKQDLKKNALKPASSKNTKRQ